MEHAWSILSCVGSSLRAALSLWDGQVPLKADRAPVMVLGPQPVGTPAPLHLHLSAPSPATGFRNHQTFHLFIFCFPPKEFESASRMEGSHAHPHPLPHSLRELGKDFICPLWP